MVIKFFLYYLIKSLTHGILKRIEKVSEGSPRETTGRDVQAGLQGGVYCFAAVAS